MKAINNFIIEKLRLGNVKIAKQFDILFEDMHFCSIKDMSAKDGKPIAICVIEENQCDNDAPIWMALYDKYNMQELRFSDIEEEIVLDSISGYENTQHLKNTVKNLKEYPAFNYVLNYHTKNTDKGDWFLGSAKELGYIFSFIEDLNQTLSKIHKQNTWEVGINFWTSNTKTKAAGTAYSAGTKKPLGQWKDNHCGILPLLKF